MKDTLRSARQDVGRRPDLRETPSIGLLAVWFGLMTGIAEIALAIARDNWWVHPDMPLTREFIWMTPLADILLFSFVGLLLILLARRWPQLAALRSTVFVFGFLGSLSILITFTQLHVIAHVLLALGIAVQAATLVSKFPTPFLTLLRLTTGWTRIIRLPGQQPQSATLPGGLSFFIGVGVLLAVVAVGMHLQERRSEQQALAALPPASANAPNVLLLVLDTVRAKNMSLYGYDRETTPHLDRWAEQGVVFDQAMAPAPWTLSSHASMFTGRWTFELNTGWFSPLNDTYQTLGEVLTARGYNTAGFAANLSYCTFKHGLDRGFIHYEDFPISPGQVVLSSSLGRALGTNSTIRNLLGYHELLNRIHGEAINEHFLAWHDDHGDRPFFAFLNYFDAHEPYLPPPPFHGAFAPRQPWGNFEHQPNGADHADKHNMSPEEVQVVVDRYDSAINYLDHHLNELFSELDRRGVLDNTLVVVTSDHGELFGEHDLFDHGNSLYQPLLHVPLVIHFPEKVPTGITVPTPISLRDLPATVLDVLAPADADPLPGRSLARYWAAPDTTTTIPSDTLYADTVWDNTNMKALFLGPYKYIRSKRSGAETEEKLYRYLDDPDELNNLAPSENHRQQLERMRQALRELQERTTP